MSKLGGELNVHGARQAGHSEAGSLRPTDGLASTKLR